MSFRRSYQRFGANTWVTLLTKENIPQKIFLRDLSCRGAGINHNFPLKLNERVTLTIQKPFFNQPQEKTAKVAWSKKIQENHWQSGLDFGLDNLIDLAEISRHF